MGIPTHSTIILYGTYQDSLVYPHLQEIWESKSVHLQVITPNEITAEHDSRR